MKKESTENVKQRNINCSELKADINRIDHSKERNIYRKETTAKRITPTYMADKSSVQNYESTQEE